MKIAIGSDLDHSTVEGLASAIEELGHSVIRIPAPSTEEECWVDVGSAVGHSVQSGEARFGVACCYTGTGVAMAANKVEGVRAALCEDEETAEGSRLFNHANVLAIGLRQTNEEQAAKILKRWLKTPNGGGEHRTSVGRLSSLEEDQLGRGSEDRK